MGKPLSEMTLRELWELFPIQLVEHGECWDRWYREERTALLVFLPGPIQIHHIGSTAVSGIWAKPIIDILLEAPSSDHQKIRDLLTGHGYICMSESRTRTDFNKGYTPSGFAERVFHLHLREVGDHDELYFRDYLNDHPDIAKAYERLKLSLWKPYEHDRDGYTEQKTEFVKEYTQKAIQSYGRAKRWDDDI